MNLIFTILVANLTDNIDSVLLFFFIFFKFSQNIGFDNANYNLHEM